MTEKYFYKFYPINQNLYSSIINNELHFSNPRNFNDPFDSYPRFMLTESMEKLKKFYDFLSSKLSSKIKDNILNNESSFKKHEEYKEIISTFFQAKIFEEDLYTNEIDDNETKLIELYTFYCDETNFYNAAKSNLEFLQIKMYYDYIYLIIDNTNLGISCGSTNPQCPLMWAHYANNHRGICIKYNFELDGIQNICLDENETLDILKVNYSNNAIDIFNYPENQLENLKFEILTNKYSKWKYEKEVRLIHQNRGLLKIKRQCIKEIIFGCKSTPKDRYTIIKLFASLLYKVDNLMIAKRLPNVYELSIRQMKMNDLADSGVYMEEINFGYKSTN
jgi:hypothetical protein